MKKNYLLTVAWVLLMLPTFAQNIAINTDASLPNGNAILDIKSGNKGLLIPRMDSASRKAIPNTKGLLVYDTTTNGFWYNTGVEWQSIATGALATTALAASGPWLLTGNSGTVDSVNFLGTTDLAPLNFRVNNEPAGQVDIVHENAFLGHFAGSANTTGGANAALGEEALMKTTTGSDNIAIGEQALRENTTAVGNIGIGFLAMGETVTGDFNVSIGFESMVENRSGSNNIALGYGSLIGNNTGSNNVAIGSLSMMNNNVGNYNTASGYGSLNHNTDASSLTATGSQSLFFNTTGSGNTASGAQSLYSNTTGNYNTATGSQSLYSNTTAFHGTATGYQSLYSNTTGDGNTANGFQSLYLNSTGSGNTADGYLALDSNTTGYENVAAGQKSLYANTTGFYNSAIGVAALAQNTTGPNNTAVGSRAMNVNTTGTANTAIGSFSNVSAANLTNATALGYGAVVNASNKVRIGNSAVTVIEGQVPFTTPSDGRFKFHVQEDVKGLDFILQLRPVTYQFDTRRFDEQLNHPTNEPANPANYALQAAYDEASRIRRSGFIAQEVEQAANVSGYDFSGIIRPKTDQDHYSLSYDAFVVPLVKAVQEQQQLIETQNRKIADLQQQIDEIKRLLPHSK